MAYFRSQARQLVLELCLLVLELNNTLHQFFNFVRGHTRSLATCAGAVGCQHSPGPSRFPRLKDAPLGRGLPTLALAFGAGGELNRPGGEYHTVTGARS
jgi:hypothetical protein